MKEKILTWIKESYLIILQMAWDREFYDRFTGKYTYADLLKRELNFLVISMFSEYGQHGHRLGLDQRNQWDMYRDLPGGTTQLRSFVKMSRHVRYQIFYCI